ncbi:MAG: serine/threonine protein kinase [Chloroflexota bacterium]|nr:serine/threonine protein kinase [Chloroflexota bacterium]
MNASPSFSSGPPLGGRYAPREPLGEGTFAVTYLAEDLVLGRLVAVKVLRQRYGADTAATARFEREARAAAAVSSPYTVDVFDYGTDQGASYIVLQYVDGPTLRERLDQVGRFEPREAVRLAVEVLRGLAAIHQAGIVHRDVKPQNVLLDRHGTARVSDFGVALWAGTETLTSHGMAVGTAVYMAPEQAQATAVTEAADLYAVGVLLFEMLTGKQPFYADNPTALMLAHVQRQPPLPCEALPGLVLPIALEREVMRALAKQPGDRRRTAAEMANALETAFSQAAPNLPGSAAAGQGGTTASLSAVAVPVAPATRTDARAIGPPRRQSSPWARSWIGPLALVLVALTVLSAIVMRGGFSGLAGIPGGSEDGRVAVPSERSPTPMPMARAPATATVTPDGSADGLFSPLQLDRRTQTPEPAITIATESPPPTELPPPTAMATETPAPPPTEPAATASPDESELDRERRSSRRNQEREQNPDSIAPDESSAGSSDGAIQFSAGAWQGAAPVDADSFGRPAVALYGTEGDFGRAVLRFDLPEQPVTSLRLTLSGLGDESGLAFPFAVEVNGMYAVTSPLAFANWHPGQDGVNGEHAVWDQVSFTLAPEFFQAGPNEVAIVSLSPGRYDDRPPYLLLSDATLAPRTDE